MARRPKLPRIVSAVARAGYLHATLDDGTSVAVPVKVISPRRGKADWSQITLEFKGAHLVVPVAGGDYPEHEVPGDVLKRVGEAVNAPSSAKPKRPGVAVS